MTNSKTQTPAAAKPVYRVKNWAEYDQALVQRGSLTFWLADDFAESWGYSGNPQRGAQFDYSAQAITTILTLKEVFHLTNRAAEGFVRSIFALLALDLPVPDHTTLSRRAQTLPVALPKKTKGALTIVADSTGLKIYGEGEWKVRMHGKSKRRTWRKLHVAVDADSGEFQAVSLSANHISDAQMSAALLGQIEQPIEQFAGDGAYDKRKVYQALDAHSPAAEVLIPPRKGARIWQHGNTKAERHKRDENLRYVRKHGKRAWKKQSGYHVRAAGETAMFRLKTIFGDSLSARLQETQTTQALLRCAALNRMTHLGMPESYPVA